MRIEGAVSRVHDQEAIMNGQRPEDLARHLGVSGRQIRYFLRKEYPRTPTEHAQPWYLTEKQVAAVKRRFSQR